MSTIKRVCPACGRVLPSDAAFCPHDGSALAVGGAAARKRQPLLVVVICCVLTVLLACCGLIAAVLLGAFEPREEVWLPVAVHSVSDYGEAAVEGFANVEIERDDTGVITRVVCTRSRWLDYGRTGTSTSTMDWTYDDQGRISCISESVHIPNIDEATGEVSYTEGTFNHRYSYDDSDHLVREDLDDGTSFAYFWEGDRVVRSAYTTMSYGPTTYYYDESGRLESLQYGDGDASSPVVEKYTWAYDANGNVAHHTFEQGSEFECGPIVTWLSDDGSTTLTGVKDSGIAYQVEPTTGRVVSATVRNLDGSLAGSGRFEYDDRGRMIQAVITSDYERRSTETISVEYRCYELTAEQKERAQEYVELRPTFDSGLARPVYQSPVLPRIDLAYCHHPPFTADSPERLLDYVSIAM